MGRDITLTPAAGGGALAAYHAVPDDARRGGLVVVADTAGVTAALRDLCDGFAADGYEVIAPRLSGDAPWDEVQRGVQAAIDALEAPVNLVGYGWGGTAAWLAACRCDGLAAASSYYAERIADLMAETPRCPAILHFGKRDPAIPPDVVEQIAAAHPDLPVFLYDAGHGFASDSPTDHHADSARLARLRTLQLFQRSSGVRAEL